MEADEKKFREFADAWEATARTIGVEAAEFGFLQFLETMDVAKLSLFREVMAQAPKTLTQRTLLEIIEGNLALRQIRKSE